MPGRQAAEAPSPHLPSKSQGTVLIPARRRGGRHLRGRAPPIAHLLPIERIGRRQHPLLLEHDWGADYRRRRVGRARGQLRQHRGHRIQRRHGSRNHPLGHLLYARQGTELADYHRSARRPRRFLGQQHDTAGGGGRTWLGRRETVGDGAGAAAADRGRWWVGEAGGAPAISWQTAAREEGLGDGWDDLG